MLIQLFEFTNVFEHLPLGFHFKCSNTEPMIPVNDRHSQSWPVHLRFVAHSWNTWTPKTILIIDKAKKISRNMLFLTLFSVHAGHVQHIKYFLTSMRNIHVGYHPLTRRIQFYIDHISFLQHSPCTRIALYYNLNNKELFWPIVNFDSQKHFHFRKVNSFQSYYYIDWILGFNVKSRIYVYCCCGTM